MSNTKTLEQQWPKCFKNKQELFQSRSDKHGSKCSFGSFWLKKIKNQWRHENVDMEKEENQQDRPCVKCWVVTESRRNFSHSNYMLKMLLTTVDAGWHCAWATGDVIIVDKGDAMATASVTCVTTHRGSKCHTKACIIHSCYILTLAWPTEALSVTQKHV